MTDGELEQLLQQADGLRRDAFLALKVECRKRNIMVEMVKEKENSLINANIERIRENISKEDKKWWNGVLSYAFERKFNNASNDEILAGLLGMRASLDEALYIENNLQKLAGERLNQASTDRIGGTVKTIGGMAIITIVFLASLGNNAMIFGGIIMVFGLVEIANAASRKSRYQTIIQNIENQTQEQDGDVGDVSEDRLISS